MSDVIESDQDRTESFALLSMIYLRHTRDIDCKVSATDLKALFLLAGKFADRTCALNDAFDAMKEFDLKYPGMLGDASQKIQDIFKCAATTSCNNYVNTSLKRPRTTSEPSDDSNDSPSIDSDNPSIYTDAKTLGSKRQRVAVMSFEVGFKNPKTNHFTFFDQPRMFRTHDMAIFWTMINPDAIPGSEWMIVEDGTNKRKDNNHLEYDLFLNEMCGITDIPESEQYEVLYIDTDGDTLQYNRPFFDVQGYATVRIAKTMWNHFFKNVDTEINIVKRSEANKLIYPESDSDSVGDASSTSDGTDDADVLEMDNVAVENQAPDVPTMDV